MLIARAGTTNKELDALISAQPRTKEDFITLSTRIIEFIVKKHQDKPLYATFVEHHVRALAEPLRDVEVRKAASGLTTLANEKQKAQRDAASGKKKSKAATKPALGSAKVAGKCVPTPVSPLLRIADRFTELLTRTYTTSHWMTSEQMLTISCSLPVPVCPSFFRCNL
jgi:hypothetical protein